MEEILNKIIYFNIEIAKAGLDMNLNKQQENLEKVQFEIIKYLNNNIEVSEKDSLVINVIIASLENIKRKYLTHEFIKDEKKRVQVMSKKLSDAKVFLNTELQVLKDYIVDKHIVLRRP
jgi:formyltetrahydrofolate synthetase